MGGNNVQDACSRAWRIFTKCINDRGYYDNENDLGDGNLKDLVVECSGEGT